MAIFVGKTVIALVGAVTAAGPYIADWNETHIHNPRWPPHAKFHGGQTMSIGAVLGLATLWYLYTPALGAAQVSRSKWVLRSILVDSVYALDESADAGCAPEPGTTAPALCHFTCVDLLDYAGFSGRISEYDVC